MSRKRTVYSAGFKSTATINLAGSFDSQANINSNEIDLNLSNNEDDSNNSGVAAAQNVHSIPTLNIWALLLLMCCVVITLRVSRRLNCEF